MGVAAAVRSHIGVPSTASTLPVEGPRNKVAESSHAEHLHPVECTRSHRPKRERCEMGRCFEDILRASCFAKLLLDLQQWWGGGRSNAGNGGVVVV